MADPAEALGFGGEPPHDYDARPLTRRSQRPPSRAVTILTAVGAVAVGFLLTAGLGAGRDAAVAQDERRDELIRLIHVRQENTAALGEQLDALRAGVAAAEETATGGIPTLQERVAEVEVVAGLTPVVGPGLRVSLSDADPGCSEFEENCRIHDSDLQLAINALFAAGAEGVAVNGERVIATTAVRSAGHTILVNYRPLTNPYVLEAVGDPELLAAEFARADFTDLFVTWEQLYGLGLKVEQVVEAELPAYAGSVRLRNATVGRVGSEDGESTADGVTP